MKKILSVILTAVLLLCTFVPCYGADTGTFYYIDSVNGNDLNDGTSESQAWKTVANLTAIELGAGDGVLFARGGKYECDALTFTCSGTEENPVVISSYGDEGAAKPLLYTDKKLEVLRLYDCSYVTVSDFEITAHNGGGIWVDTFNRTSVGVKLTKLDMHDMQNINQNSRDNLSAGAAYARACVMVKGLPARSRYAVNGLTISDCEMYDTGNGISLWGSWNDEQKPHGESEKEADPIFNENTLIENVYFHDMTAESVIVGISKNALVTNCRSINCCQDEGVDENGNVKFYNAAMWFWGSVYCTFDHCEIAGQKNVGDGMTVDFDSYSHYCTYQYIYSHDNIRFMNNCAIYDGQRGNSVHHCLSVNDNKDRVRFSASSGEYGFSFYNNTLVNCGDICFMNLYDSTVCNNIFMPKLGCTVTSDGEELIKNRNNTYRNNCYYNCLNPLVDPFSQNTVPGFVSDDYTNPDSFKLAKLSTLIGRGYKNVNAEASDFFGNSTEKNNIGCYGGAGEDKILVKTLEGVVEHLLRMIVDAGAFIFSSIKKIF